MICFLFLNLMSNLRPYLFIHLLQVVLVFGKSLSDVICAFARGFTVGDDSCRTLERSHEENGK